MQKRLPDGLILRSISEDLGDKERLPEFYGDVFGEDRGEREGAGFFHWARNILNVHPVVTDDDIWVIVDPSQQDKIVSALVLISQTWRYEDVEFGIGQPELIATEKSYRRRGLVRELMNVAHERSAKRGHLAQGITGIPYFYRQFGYEMTIELGGRNVVPLFAIPPLAEGEQQRFSLRVAGVEDIPFLLECQDYASKQYLLTTKRQANLWQAVLEDTEKLEVYSSTYLMIVNQNQAPVGFLVINNPLPDENEWQCFGYGISEKTSYLDTAFDVLRGLKTHIQTTRPHQKIDYLFFATGIHETIDKLLDGLLGTAQSKHPYAWYMRVPNLALFIQTIAAVLERRLKDSGANRYTGELKIGFYHKNGLVLRFLDGKIIEVSSQMLETPHCTFPDDTFLHLLFGYRSYDELRYLYPDIQMSPKAHVLLDILFPKRRSWLLL